MREAPCSTRIILLGFLLIALFGGSDGQKKTKVGTSIAGSDIQAAVDFECPEEFGYYPAPGDCTRYYVCVFGGALLESCTGGLAYSHELQTCDWPRNVDCIGGGTNNQVVTTASKPKATKPSNSNNPVTQFLEGSNSRTSQTSTKSRAPIEDFDELSMSLDQRQGREFGSTSSSRGSSKNTFTGQQETLRSSSSRPSTVDVEFDDDFVPATTFNPSSSRFLNSRSLQIETHDGDDDYDYDDNDGEFTPFQPPIDRNAGSEREQLNDGDDDSDGQEFWNSRNQRIPSMHFGSGGSASSQRHHSEPLQFGPVPVRGGSSPESRQFQSADNNEPVITQGRFQPIIRPEQQQPQFNRAQFRDTPLPVPIHLRTTPPPTRPQPPPVPNPSHSQSFNRSPTNPLTTIPFETDIPDDVQQQSRPWNPPPPARPQQLQRPAIESAATQRTTTINPSTEQFFREVTSTVQKQQQPTAATTFDFEDWAKQHEQPSRAPVREQQQQQQVVRPTVESVAPPPARITAPVPSKSSQQQASRVQQPAVVDYDDFAAGEEEFVEYDDFSDVVPQTKPPVRQQQQEFEAPVRTTSTTTTTTTTTTTQKPKPKVTASKPVASSSSSVRGASRFRPDAAASVEEEPDIPVQQTSNKRRPTLKPVSDLVPSKQASEPGIDIFKHPPKRLEPIFAQPIPDEPAAKCERDICRLPDCFCGGKDIPGGLKTKDVPQLVLLTFDDSVNDLNKELYKDLFETGRTNPNGCPIAATFYVSHEWTDYGQVQNLYADGHEIASHTISHSFGEQFSAKKWAKEAAGQRDVLAAYGGVRLEDVRGLRAPFLSVGGNRMFKMLYDLNFTYDSSMPVYENKPPSWPYTLDYKIFHDCMIPPCPTKSYPGVWEVPMVMWQDLNGGRCSMGDGCSNPPDAEGIYKMLIKNFERHYTSNRSPFPLYYHAAWFTTPHHKEGFEAFLDTIVSMDDVWLVTNWQAIQWVRDPTPLDRVKSFKPFQCDYPERPKRCNSAKVCNSWHKSGVRYMRTCQPCPEVFPWTGKTGVRNTFLDSYEGNEAS